MVTSASNFNYYVSQGFNVEFIKELIQGVHYKMFRKDINNTLKSMAPDNTYIAYERSYYFNSSLHNKADKSPPDVF